MITAPPGEDFGALRWCLAAAPSEASWRALCAVVDRFDDQALEQTVVPYLEERLASWPDRLRFAPARWLFALLTHDRARPHLRLTRALRRPVTTRHPSGRSPRTDVPDPSGFWRREVLTPETLPRLLGHPALQHLTCIDLTGLGLGPTLVGALAQPEAPRPHTLELAFSRLEDADLARLIGSEALGAVTHLGLAGNDLSPEGLEALMGASFEAPRGLSLDLSRVEVPASSVAALLEAPWASRLVDLSLEAGAAGDEALVALAQTPRAMPLTRLKLTGGRFGLRGAEALGQARHLGLEALLLPGCRPMMAAEVAAAMLGGALLEGLEDLNLGHLERWSQVPTEVLARAAPARLKTLRLRHSALDDARVERLVQAMPGLTALHLEGNAIGIPGAAALGRALRPQTLELDDNPLGDAGLAALIDAGALARLERLDARRAGLTGAAVEALASSPQAAALRHLALSGNLLGDRGLVALGQSPHLGGLRTLELTRVHAGAAGLQALMGADARLPALGTLDLTRNRLDGVGAQAVARSSLARRLDFLALPYSFELEPEARPVLGAAPLPQRHKNNARDDLSPWYWTLADIARRPPGAPALAALIEEAARLLPGEAAAGGFEEVFEALERWWPDPWRARAVEALERAGLRPWRR